MRDFREEAVRHALRRMFRPDGFFDVCTVDQCLKAVGRLPGPDYQALRALHCVYWSEMTTEMQREVAQRTMALFAEPTWDESWLAETPVQDVTPQRRGWFALLRGGGA